MQISSFILCSIEGGLRLKAARLRFIIGTTTWVSHLVIRYKFKDSTRGGLNCLLMIILANNLSVLLKTEKGGLRQTSELVNDLLNCTVSRR
jgi:hypothetical protein